MNENEKLESGKILEEMKVEEPLDITPKEKNVNNSYKLDNILDILNSVYKDPECMNKIQNQLSNVVTDVGNLKTLLEEFCSKSKEDSNSNLEKYKNAYLKLKGEIEVIKEQNEELRERSSNVESLNGKIELLQEEKRKLKSERDDYLERYNQEKGIRAIFESEKNEKEEMYNELLSSFSSKKQKIKDLESSLDEKKDTISKLESEKENLQEQLNSFGSKKKAMAAEIEALNKDKENLEFKLGVAENNCLDQKNLYDELNVKYEKLLPNAAILEEYSKLNMDELKKAYDLFKCFKDRTRNNLKAVFEVDSFFGFLSNSMQWDRIAGIWEQTKIKIVNDDIEDLKELRQLFLILFEIYNAGYNDAPYTLITPEIGAKYDRNEQLIKNQKSDGKISEVLLEGYIAKKTNNIHKAIISVE